MRQVLPSIPAVTAISHFDFGLLAGTFHFGSLSPVVSSRRHFAAHWTLVICAWHLYGPIGYSISASLEKHLHEFFVMSESWQQRLLFLSYNKVWVIIREAGSCHLQDTTSQFYVLSSDGDLAGEHAQERTALG
jgi:hypothetical protein